MSIGIWQLVLILVIILIIFGAGKLPKVMSDVGLSLKNFKKNVKDEDNSSTKITKKKKSEIKKSAKG